MLLLSFLVCGCLFATVKLPNSSKSILVDSNNKRFIVASCAELKVIVDGRLDETAWDDVNFQSEFLQREPNEGQPATERTEVGVLYDNKNIYFGLKCYDSEPDKIIAKEMRRDADMRDDDHINLILDTYHDRRSGFYFVTNPHGSKRDAVLANEGRNYNSAWDGIWTARAQKNDQGWFAEIAIPWKTLRFSEQDSVVWGINFSRTIRRKNEEVFWQLVPRDLGYFGMFRLSEAGTLCGLEDLKMGGNLEFKPYFMGGVENDQVTDFKTDAISDVGLDAKIAVTPNLALDLTVNTDFAQVEADREQVNLTRFSLYYPEKREFFLEGAEVFAFGRSGGRFMRHGGSGVNLFYSRRIGIVSGHEARILGGAKLVGKIGQFNLGVLNMVTDGFIIPADDEDEEDEQIPSSNYTVIRLRRDIMRRGSIGMMFLNKEDIKSTDYNRSFGIDGYFPLNRHFTISGTIAGTFEPNDDGSKPEHLMDKNLAGTLSLNYDSDLWDFSLSYMDVGDDFNPEVGFVRRTDYRYTNASINYSPRPNGRSSIRQFSYRLSGNYRTDHDNRMLDNEINASFTIRFQNSSRFTIGVQKENEYIDYDWEVRDGFLIPEDTYGGWDGYFRYSTDQSKDISARMDASYGTYFTGKSTRLGFGGRMTRIPRLRVELDYNHYFVDLPEGSFKTNTLGLRTFYFFSTELFLKAYVQWNGDKLSFEGKEKIVSNILLRWIYKPGSDLYLVFNDGRLVGPGGTEIQNRTVMAKMTFFWRK